ncbi:hypothetical protein DXT99_23550 [Pontibacter diazotrophicus]|uniref:Uncharacterized protein n=1 Tax=Pontibacter diazotrophicus TaxID=1400979 RepID=A0A3D8L3J6_9BACT|nr:hypothetical protein [Pontibacter diazotrophicus]RDV11883.1 hypothetical protein DXT99_23550 [Pontibacter diazotrophicus]
MSKNNSLLDSIKAKIGAENSPVGAAPAVTLKVVPEREQPTPAATPDKKELSAAQQAQDIDMILSEGGFMQLFKVLEAARKDMEIERKAVYVDEESAEVLDLLKKKAKIKSNVLVSYLLQEFFSKHKELIQELVEKRSNKLLD